MTLALTLPSLRGGPLPLPQCGRGAFTGRKPMSIAYRPAGIGVAALLATPASAQLLAHKDLSMATALTIATTAIETCKGQGYRVSATVVGRGGEVIVQLRGDDSGPHTIENSQRKAYTA